MRPALPSRRFAILLASIFVVMASTVSEASIIIVDDFRSPAFEDIIYSDTGPSDMVAQGPYTYSADHRLAELGTRRRIFLSSMAIRPNLPRKTTKVGLREEHGGELYISNKILAETLSLQWSFDSPIDLSSAENTLLQIEFGELEMPETSEFKLSMYGNNGLSISTDRVKFSGVSDSIWILDLSPYQTDHDLSEVQGIGLSSLSFASGAEFAIRQFRIVPEPISFRTFAIGMGGVLFASQRRRDQRPI